MSALEAQHPPDLHRYASYQSVTHVSERVHAFEPPDGYAASEVTSMDSRHATMR
jgi:hypothetical protein